MFRPLVPDPDRRTAWRAAALVAFALSWAPTASATPAEPATNAAAGAIAPATPTSAAPAPPDARAAVEEGVWIRREHDFTYLGLTSFYSCDSLASKLRTLLKMAGARDDLRASPRGCAEGLSQISRFPSARLVFWTFVPAALAPPPPEAKPAPPAKQLGKDAPKLKRGDVIAPEPGTGAWRTVTIDGRRVSSLIEPGDCELVEQFRREVLPLFTTRNVGGNLRCTPHQVQPWDVDLTFDVLGPVPSADVTRR
jgi:hypothetical protein